MSFLKNQDTARRDLITFWIYTGLRPEEICALKWEHIDLFQRQVLIRETRKTNGSEGPPKTQSSYREIALNQPNQAPWTHNRLQKKFTPLPVRAGLRYRAVGELRRAFAALALSLGENITWVSKVLGHSTVQMTLSKYNRYAPNLTRREVP